MNEIASSPAAPLPHSKSAPFLRLSRQFFDHIFWEEQRAFSFAEAWLDCLQQAAFKPYRRLIGQQVVDVPIGAFAAAERFLAQRWSWSRGKVRDFLALLEREGLITRKKTTACTLIFLCELAVPETVAPEKKPAPSPASDREKPKVVEDKEKKALSHARRAPALVEVLSAANRLGVDPEPARRYFFSRQKLAGPEARSWRDRHGNEILDWESDLQGFAISWADNLRGTETEDEPGIATPARPSAARFRASGSEFFRSHTELRQSEVEREICAKPCYDDESETSGKAGGLKR